MGLRRPIELRPSRAGHLHASAIELDPGESVVLTLEIEAPNTFIAPSGSQVKCGYQNKVEILEPAGGTPPNTDAGDDIATADVKFAPFEKHGQKFCEPGLTTPPPPPPPACPQGWSPTPVPGKCCPAGSAWDGEQCNRACRHTAQECEPGPNETRNAQGKCVCKSGFVRNPNGLCVPPRPHASPVRTKTATPSRQCGMQRELRA